MAAGKVGVLSNGDFSNVSRKVSNSCEGYGYGEFGYGVKIRSKTNVGHGRKRDVFDIKSKYKGRESMEVDNGVVLSPPQKRRKFSPVLCNMEDAHPSFVSRETNLYTDDLEPGELVEEDFSRVPNVLTSRWAYDDDDQKECSRQEKGRIALKGKEVKERSSSPKSGVTQKEESDGFGNRSSGSNSVDACSVRDLGNDECMELDVSDDEDYFVSDPDSNSDKGAKDGVCRGGRKTMLQGCRIVGKEYERLGVINEGSYGIVYKARDLTSEELVALKKMKMGNEGEGFPVCYLREINTLLSLNHPSIVSAREVVIDDSPNGFDNVYLVMDYVEHDLKSIMGARKQRFYQSEVKCLMLQLLEGVKYLHDNWVVHRDLKPSNILFNNKGELKICDFGMSRQYGSSLKPYTALVVTLWYRAPELLLGAKTYSTAVDMWSVGCIMAELLTNKTLFDGKTELEQLGKIFRMLGTPNDKIWPGYSQLPGVKVNFVHQPYSLLHKEFPRASFTAGSPALSDLGFDLLSRLLTYDPEKRISAEDALNHRWFQEVPLPTTKEFMPTFPADKLFMHDMQ